MKSQEERPPRPFNRSTPHTPTTRRISPSVTVRRTSLSASSLTGPLIRTTARLVWRNSPRQAALSDDRSATTPSQNDINPRPRDQLRVTAQSRRGHHFRDRAPAAPAIATAM
jgi:hypothetical protein